MGKTYKHTVVIRTADDIDREESISAANDALAVLEHERDGIYQAYIEDDSGIDVDEGSRLLDMLSELDESDLNAALETMEQLTDDSDNQNT